MTQDKLRQYIEGIMLDVRGDNPYPADIILKANASLILREVNQHVTEVIGDLVAETYHCEDCRDVHEGAQCGVAINRHIASQRKRAGL